MKTPPPPSQRQADEAQQARYAAEAAVLPVFESTGAGGGESDNDLSVLHSVKLSAILTALTLAVVFVSFRNPRDRAKILLDENPDYEKINKKILPKATDAFYRLVDSDMTNEQRAILWATWLHSNVSNEVAKAVNSGRIKHPFDGENVTLRKIWISRSDRRVRPLHAQLHGKTIPADGDFWRWPQTGHRLRWPGDRDAPPEAVIGCRCVCPLSWANQTAVSKTIKKLADRSLPDS